MNFLKKASFCSYTIVLALSYPLNGMNKQEQVVKKTSLVQKFVGGAKASGGAAIGIPNALMTAKMLNHTFAGCKPAEILATAATTLGHPGILIHGGAAVAGAIALVGGVKEILSNNEGKEEKVEAGQVIIKYKGTQSGREYFQRLDGTDVDNFLGLDGFLVTWRDNYPIQQENEKYIKIINDETKTLQRQHGAPVLYTNNVQIADPQLRAEHAQKIENPVGVDILANNLAQKENFFAALRRLAVHSWGRPSEKDNLALFTKPASEAMAKLMLATAASLTYPYEELVRNERAAKYRLQLEFNQERDIRNRLQNDYNQAQANFVQEQAAKNQIHANFILEQNARNQLQQNLNQTEQTLAQSEEALEAERAAKQQADQNTQRAHEEARRINLDLQDAQQANQDNENLLETYRDRIVRLADLNHVTTQTLEQTQQLYTTEAESTRLNSEFALLLQQNLDQERQRRTTETENLRRQFESARSQISPLRRLNEELIRRLAAAESKLKEQAAAQHTKHEPRNKKH